jgi:hypothetical protein
MANNTVAINVNRDILVRDLALKQYRNITIYRINTYDFNANIAELYSDLPTKTYQLQYSANRKRKEVEFLFHNTNTTVSSFDKVQFVDF